MKAEMDVNEKRGFPGMIGSIDCCHWQWHRCPIAWQGQFQDRKHQRSLVVEAIAGHDTYFHQAFAGLPGSLNDIKIMGRTDLQHKYMMSSAFDHAYKLYGDSFTGTFCTQRPQSGFEQSSQLPFPFGPASLQVPTCWQMEHTLLGRISWGPFLCP